MHDYNNYVPESLYKIMTVNGTVIWYEAIRPQIFWKKGFKQAFEQRWKAAAGQPTGFEGREPQNEYQGNSQNGSARRVLILVLQGVLAE